METESEFAPWDLSKAHILVSTPDVDLDIDELVVKPMEK